jgi:hypothetical protein
MFNCWQCDRVGEQAISDLASLDEESPFVVTAFMRWVKPKPDESGNYKQRTDAVSIFEILSRFTTIPV